MDSDGTTGLLLSYMFAILHYMRQRVVNTNIQTGLLRPQYGYPPNSIHGFV